MSHFVEVLVKELKSNLDKDEKSFELCTNHPSQFQAKNILLGRIDSLNQILDFINEYHVQEFLCPSIEQMTEKEIKHISHTKKYISSTEGLKYLALKNMGYGIGALGDENFCMTLSYIKFVQIYLEEIIDRDQRKKNE